jgi:hypothetical protein
LICRAKGLISRYVPFIDDGDEFSLGSANGGSKHKFNKPVSSTRGSPDIAKPVGGVTGLLRIVTFF